MTETNVIYNEDCLEGMKKIPERSIDLIVCDLPYGTLNRSNPASRWDKRLDMKKLWEQYDRIRKPDTPVILFGQGMFSAEVMASRPELWRYNLVWVKDRVTGYLNANRMPMRQHEDIMVFYGKLPVYHPQMRRCQPEERNHNRRTEVVNTNRCYGGVKALAQRISDDKYPTSVIYIPKEHTTGAFFHPTQKPVALIEYLIRTYSDEDDVVLDNCMGSGTTAVAAIRADRRFIGYEIDKGFYGIAQERIRKEIYNRKL